MPPFIPRKRRRSPSAVEPSSSGSQKISTKRPTLFDTLDASPKTPRTVQDNRTFLDELNGKSDSSLSDLSSSEFEDALLDQPSLKRRRIEDDADEDDEMDWEDAMIPGTSISTPHAILPSTDLEITLDKVGQTSSLTDPHGRKKGPSQKEREIRIATHCMHVQFLMFHNLVRNAWVCDDEVQKILVEQLPASVKKEIEKWRVASGMLVERPQEENGRPVMNRKALKHKNQRDWGQHADRQEDGVPNMSRGDPLARLLKVLALYWRKAFTTTAPGLRKQGYKPLAVLEEEIASLRLDKHNPEEHGERINDLAQFRGNAKKRQGSRDVGAQLFTALVRGLGLEARLVASLQPIGFGWSKNEEAAAKKKRGRSIAGKGAQFEEHQSSGENQDANSSDLESTTSMDEPVAIDRRKVKSRLKAPANGLVGKGDRDEGAKDNPVQLVEKLSDSTVATDGDEDDSVIDVTPQTSRTPLRKRFDRDLPFPIYWTEVVSPITKKIIPVDSMVLTPSVAINDILLSSFEPRGAKAEKAKQVLAYVVAFSSDGTAKDVTTRYLKRHMWPGKTKGTRLPVQRVPIYNRKGKVKRYEEYDWFKSVMSGYKRGDKMRTAVDDLEDATDLKPVKPEKKRAREGEETLQGYKTSAEFVLERHLRREEALLPAAQHVRVFKTGKGENAKEEQVFRREDVMICRTGESWHKEGRQVKPGENPMKMVPVRAVTLTRKREVEEAERDGGEKLKQGLYAWDQTEWIIPPPIRNGVIPKNAFGNIDCYVPTMVPKGAVHIQRKGTMKVCKRLGIDFAEAVTGFEFGKQRAVPVITGVVVAKEYEKMVIDAWEIDEEERRRKEEGKREKVALALWRKFLMGLRIVERVREEYGGDADANTKEQMNPFTNRKKSTQQILHKELEPKQIGNDDINSREDQEMAGGFIPEDDQDGFDGGSSIPAPDETGDSFTGSVIAPERPALLTKSLIRPASSTKPVSLKSAHREVSQESLRDDVVEDPSTEIAVDEKCAKQRLRKPRSKTSTPAGNARRRDMPVGKPAKKLAREPEHSPRATNSDMNPSSELSSLQSDSDSEHSEGTYVRRRTTNARGRTVNEKNPLVEQCPKISSARTGRDAKKELKRKAARKSGIAVKSHYFDDVGSDNEDNQDSGTSYDVLTQRSIKGTKSPHGKPRTRKAKGH
ncbi:hypothetical protein MMC16_006027 [Acarospora aff. strigata]|nr:hypothetical protein [Acarospora aff. strigata]